MPYYIYGMLENQQVTFVGCSRTVDIPQNAILLQEAERLPLLNWVKWSIRFRRTLKSNKAMDHPYARYFKNPSNLTRLLEDADFGSIAAEQSSGFLNFHRTNPHLLAKLIEAALEKQGEGWREYSMDQLMGEIRWSDTEIERGDERVKLNGKWSPFYARVLQMIEPELLGFFAVRFSIANGLTWIDGRTWQQFASEHEDRIHWKDPFHDIPDGDWEYNG